MSDKIVRVNVQLFKTLLKKCNCYQKVNKIEQDCHPREKAQMASGLGSGRLMITPPATTLPVSFGRDTKSRWSLLCGVNPMRGNGNNLSLTHYSREGHSEINSQRNIL